MNNKVYLDFAKTMADKAGEVMLKYFNNANFRHKEDKTIVSIADEEINDFVIKEVEKRFPDHSVYGEESSNIKESKYTWVLDPIDGTVPYVKGVPTAAFSLALVKNGEPIVGVIYDPFMKRLYSAIKGQGANLNDNPINVSAQKLDYDALLNIEWWPEANHDIDTVCHKLSMQSKAYVLHLGSTVYASALVASGKYDACIFSGKSCVDIAAVKIIVEEAGGKVTDLFGNEQRYDGEIKGAIISNGVDHDELVSRLKVLLK